MVNVPPRVSTLRCDAAARKGAPGEAAAEGAGLGAAGRLGGGAGTLDGVLDEPKKDDTHIYSPFLKLC